MDNQIKKAKILFFVDGPSPTPEDFKAAQALNGQVMFRNARAVPSEVHSLEVCDGVAGDFVPELYAERFGSAEDAISKKEGELETLASKVGDSKAPKSKKKEAATGNAWNPNP